MPTYDVNPVTSPVAPWAVDDRIGTTAARTALGTVLMPAPSTVYPGGVDFRSGVMAAGDAGTTHTALKVTPGRGMTVTVAPGNAVIDTPEHGPYMACWPTPETVDVPASSWTSSRYDLVIGRIHDDYNPALGSDADKRRFTVELVQGDPATAGQPMVPPLPVGAIPLARLYVGSGAQDLHGIDPYADAPHNTAVADMRGPGLVARGGLRTLYAADAVPGSDAWEEPGAYPGEQRWVHGAAFPHQVYDGAETGWRGVSNELVYSDTPEPGAGGWACDAGTITEICRVIVPYPGVPYMVAPTGRVSVRQSPDTVAHMRITLDSPDGPLINWDGRDTAASGPEDSSLVYTIPALKTGPFTETKTFVLSGLVRETGDCDSGFYFSGGDTGHNLLQVVVTPAPVSPSWDCP